MKENPNTQLQEKLKVNRKETNKAEKELEELKNVAKKKAPMQYIDTSVLLKLRPS